MGVELTMPKLPDTMEEGKILSWLKHPAMRSIAVTHWPRSKQTSPTW